MLDQSDPQPEATARRRSRLAVKKTIDYSDDVEFDNVDTILALVAEVKAVKAVEHLLRKAVHRLLFLETVNFICFNKLNFEDFQLLLNLGWSIQGFCQQPDPQQQQQAQPQPQQAQQQQ